jgi:hypothetical protein
VLCPGSASAAFVDTAFDMAVVVDWPGVNVFRTAAVARLSNRTFQKKRRPELPGAARPVPGDCAIGHEPEFLLFKAVQKTAILHRCRLLPTVSPRPVPR